MVHIEILKGYQAQMVPLLRKELETDTALLNWYKEHPDVTDTVRDLHYFYYNSKIGSCGNCLIDATYKLCFLDLNSERAMKPETTFKLYAGALLQDTKEFISSRAVSNANLTDDNAWWHLAQDPEKISMFQELPENFDELANPSDLALTVKAGVVSLTYKEGKLPVKSIVYTIDGGEAETLTLKPGKHLVCAVLDNGYKTVQIEAELSAEAKKTTKKAK